MVVSGLAAIVAWGQQWSVATTHGDRSGAETAATTPAPSVPPLGSLMLSQPLAGFAVAPPGPSDGPLTASEFASQSSDPTQAEARFEALAAQPGFDAYIRLWTEKDRSGQVANDMACLLFRIPHLDDAGSFADDLAASFAGSPGVAPFDVPGIAGGRGYTVEVTAPVRASEEIIVFRSGPYVSMVQLASVASVANGSALTSNQAIAVSQRQFAALSPGVRAGTVPVAVGQSGPVPGGGRPGGASSSTRDDLVPATLAAAAVLAVVGVGVLTMVGMRRRRARRPGPDDGDQHEADQRLAAFGAVVPPPPGDRRDAVDPWALEVPIHRPPARPVPALDGSLVSPADGSVESDGDHGALRSAGHYDWR
jgi:hypothetical protein